MEERLASAELLANSTKIFPLFGAKLYLPEFDRMFHELEQETDFGQFRKFGVKLNNCVQRRQKRIVFDPSFRAHHPGPGKPAPAAAAA